MKDSPNLIVPSRYTVEALISFQQMTGLAEVAVEKGQLLHGNKQCNCEMTDKEN